MTPKIMEEIQKADVLEISDKLAQKGIPTDFKGNKVVAWGCAKIVVIFEYLNKKYKMHLALPKGIYMENFENLNIEDPSAIGFCNMARTHLIKGSDVITPSRVLYFDTMEKKHKDAPQSIKWLYDWSNIDMISDFRYAVRQSATDSFLDLIEHEFTHGAHEDKLLENFDGDILDRKIKDAKDAKNVVEYRRKYGNKISQICDYALTNPLEAIACDIPRVITSSLDKDTLMPVQNPFIGTPYENLSFWQRANIPDYTDEQRPLKEILRRFWNGKFD